MRGARKNDAMYLREVQVAGFNTVETWHTKEEFTGFLLGWDACMAEAKGFSCLYSRFLRFFFSIIPGNNGGKVLI